MPPLPDGLEEEEEVHFNLTESVYKVILQKSISAQIRQRILYYYQYKNQVTDVCGN